MTEENKAPEIIKLSASSVKTYEQCPRKYYFNYIEKAPKKEWEHFDLGNLCHHTLETFHDHFIIEKYNKKQAAKIMGEAFAKARLEYPKLTDELVAEAKQMMTDYLKMISSNGMPKVKSCEQDFDFKIADSIMVRGYIDRIDIVKDDKFRIMDYKTTKNAQYLDPFQLLVYGIWLKKTYPDVKDFIGAYVLLRHQSKLKEYSFNLIDIEAAEKKLIDYANTIRAENAWITIPSKLCNFCDFKDICPAQKQSKTW